MRAAQATSAFPAAFEHGGKAAFFVISEIIRRDFMKLKFFFDYLSYAVPACAFSHPADRFSKSGFSDKNLFATSSFSSLKTVQVE